MGAPISDDDQSEHGHGEVCEDLGWSIARSWHAAGGEPSQLHGEEVDEHEAEPEAGECDAEVGEQGDQVVGPTAGLQGGQGAEGDGDEGRQREGCAGEDDGVGESGGDDVEHGAVLGAGEAEIALERGGGPVGVALADRGVDTVDLAEVGDAGGGDVGVGAEFEVQGVARHEADEGEDDDGHEGEDDGGREQPGGEEAGHAVMAATSFPSYDRTALLRVFDTLGGNGV